MRWKNKELFLEQCKKHYEALLGIFNLSWFSGNIILSETYIGNLLFQLSENQLQVRETENCQISVRHIKNFRRVYLFDGCPYGGWKN